MKATAQDKQPSGRSEPSDRLIQGLTPAVSQTLSLYHAWLGYLLDRLGQKTVRVPAEDIQKALDTLSCQVSREGDAYVIHLHRREAGPTGGRMTETATDTEGMFPSTLQERRPLQGDGD